MFTVVLKLKKIGDIVSLNEVRFVNIRIIKTKYRQESFFPVFSGYIIKYMYTCAQALSMCRDNFALKNLYALDIRRNSMAVN